MRVKDANLIKTKALPNGATTVYSDPLDIGRKTSAGNALAEVELLIEAPALSTTELPDGQTMKYNVQACALSDFSSGAYYVAKEVLVQTGAGGAGAAAASARFRLPSDCVRYVRVAAVNSGTGNASGKSMTVSVVC